MARRDEIHRLDNGRTVTELHGPGSGWKGTCRADRIVNRRTETRIFIGSAANVRQVVGKDWNVRAY